MKWEKCETCPVGNFEGQCPHVEVCHLDSGDQRFIKAMIRGVFDCGHCIESRTTNYRPGEYVLCEEGVTSQFILSGKWPCDEWQERKEGEDG